MDTETKLKISNSMKGKNTWMKGRKLSDECKRKKSEAMKGKKHTEESKKKMSELAKKRIVNIEQIKRMNEARLKKPSVLLGRKYSIEQRKINSEAQKKILNHSGRFKKGMIGQRGQESHQWKGGITPLIQNIRRCSKYKEWSHNIMSRDNFTCKKCNIRGKEMNSHHIKKFSIIIEENKIKSIEDMHKCNDLWDLNNGVTLCKPCHYNIHKTGDSHFII